MKPFLRLGVALAALLFSISSVSTASAQTLLQAIDDAYSVAVGTTLTLPAPGLLANDIILGLATATIDLDTFEPSPVGGYSLVLENTGFFEFESFTLGEYLFRYRLSGGQVFSDFADVRVTVFDPNNPTVPEPASLALFIPGLAAFGLMIRRKRTR